MLANLVVILHLAFVLFVVLGSLLSLRWRRCVWSHIPAAIWGAFIEFAGWVCPLTPLENWLREKGGASGYNAGFIEHYLVSWLYPAALTREIQVALGLFVLVINLIVYGWFWRKAAKTRT
jgi:hypothetical protein